MENKQHMKAFGDIVVEAYASKR